MTDFFKAKNRNYLISINKIPSYDGGRQLIERLIHVYEVNSRVELGDLINVTPGTMSTWTTRNTTPYEVLIRTSLATGVPLEYLCFGTGDKSSSNVAEKKVVTEPDEAFRLPILEIKSIEDGSLRTIEKIRTDSRAFEIYRILPRSGDFAIRSADKTYFINARAVQVSKGQYLFSTNGVYQLGELRLMPDGNIYLFDGDDKYSINSTITQIHGKIASTIINS